MPPPDTATRIAPPVIAVFGGGLVAKLCILALARSLRHTRIVWVPTPVGCDALADHAHTAHPSLSQLHERIGIDDSDLLAKASGSHRFAIRYEAWRRDGQPWMVGYGGNGELLRQPGETQRYGVLNAASALAEAGRFARPSDRAGALASDLDCALRFDPIRYGGGLQALIGHLPVLQIDSTPAAVLRDERGHVGAVTLTDGTQLEASLYVDATGPERRLLGLLGSAEWTDWSDVLPVDRLIEGRQSSVGVPPLFDCFEGQQEGWMYRSPGFDMTRVGFAFHSKRTAPDAAEARLVAATLCDNLQLRSIHAGRLGSPFAGNVVAIGDAAAAFEPLGWCNLHLAVRSIALLLDLIPTAAVAHEEAREFNRRWSLLADRAGDYVAAHYRGLYRTEPFWLRAADLALSERLRRTLDEFGRRSRLPYFEEECICPDQWLQLLLGSGTAHGPSPKLAALSREETDERRIREYRRLDELLHQSLPYDHYIRQGGRRQE